MDWARMLAYVTGTVDQELLARNEYLTAENRILKAQLNGRLKLSDAERSCHFPRHELSLIYDATRSRRIHENHTTGEKIELLGPWNVMGDLSAVNQKFDDMREAIEHFNPQRARQIKSHEPSYLCLYSNCRSC